MIYYIILYFYTQNVQSVKITKNNEYNIYSTKKIMKCAGPQKHHVLIEKT